MTASSADSRMDCVVVASESDVCVIFFVVQSMDTDTCTLIVVFRGRGFLKKSKRSIALFRPNASLRKGHMGSTQQPCSQHSVLAGLACSSPHVEWSEGR